jgi:hypothetical protein
LVAGRAVAAILSGRRRSVHVLKLFGLERFDRAGADFIGAHGAGYRECLKPALDQLLLVLLIESGGFEPPATGSGIFRLLQDGRGRRAWPQPRT